MAKSINRIAIVVWVLLIAAFAALHALHLRADFPNHSPWHMDYAKYTDEGWYGNAAVRSHLFGSWYIPGDFNVAPAVPVWPFLEWILFFFTGVSMVAARGLAVAFFIVNLLLSYTLLRVRSTCWTALLALTLIVTNPFLYAFSRLAILEPLLTACFLAALNLAVRLPRSKRPIVTSAVIGLLYTMMLFTKTSAAFLLPALAWAILAALHETSEGWRPSPVAIRSLIAAAASAAISTAVWMAFIIHRGLLADFKYLFFVNKYVKPPEWYWPFWSFWWSFHGSLWIDTILIPLAGILFLLALALLRSKELKNLFLNPVYGASILAIAGYILFMTYQNHPQPRYYVVVAVFAIFALVLAAEALVTAPSRMQLRIPRLLGITVIAAALIAACFNAFTTITWATHPEYTWFTAAKNLTHYIDKHPNGKRLMVSISGDEITMMTHLPTLCDDFGTMELPDKMAKYQPGWWATWNEIDGGTLEDIHTHFNLEQVASFPAFDDPERDMLVLFKLHPLPNGETRDPGVQNLRVKLPGDTFDLDVNNEP